MLEKDKKDDNDSDNDKFKKKDKDKKAKIITYKLRFIDNCRFMQDSLLNLVDHLAGINNKVSEIDNKNVSSNMSILEPIINTWIIMIEIKNHHT